MNAYRRSFIVAGALALLSMRAFAQQTAESRIQRNPNTAPIPVASVDDRRGLDVCLRGRDTSKERLRERHCSGKDRDPAAQSKASSDPDLRRNDESDIPETRR